MSKQILAGIAIAAALSVGALKSWSQDSTTPFLGITATDTEGTPKGALIVEVSSESPAKRAGFRRGDVVLSVAGAKIQSNEQLLAELKKQAPGKEVVFEILRNGKEEMLTAVPVVQAMTQKEGERPSASPRGFRLRVPNAGADAQERILREFQEQMQSSGRPMMGVVLQPMDEELRQKLGLKEQGGVAIADVEKNSPAEKAGLSATDVILEVDGQPVSSAPDVIQILQKRKAGDVVTLKLIRDGKATQIKVTLENRTPSTDPFSSSFGRNSLLPPSGFGLGNPFDNLPPMTIPNRPDASAAGDKIRKLEKRIESLEATIRRMDEELQRLKRDRKITKEGK